MDFFKSPLVLSLFLAWVVLFAWLIIKQRRSKKCPRCRKLIGLTARKCPKCGFEFPDQEIPWSKPFYEP
jgi:predicted amidophosphoribosyltransferase